MRRPLLSVALVALILAGAAGAYALRTIYLQPGKCTTVAKTRVCARAAPPVTVTVSPSPLGRTLRGNGDQTLAPITLAHGVEVHWTSQPDSDGVNFFAVTSTSGDVDFDNGDGTSSGESYLEPGTYTLQVTSYGAWTLSF